MSPTRSRDNNANLTARDYVKGTTVQVLDSDTNGFPTNSIERDPDGALWHVREGQEPVSLANDDEARAVASEHASTKDGK
jgi:hypothetical protein